MTKNQYTEYKQKLIDELEKEVIASLNSREGGIIYLEADKHRNIVDILNF